MKSRPVFPFVAIVGQERLKRALLLNVINPALAGVLVRGEKGTAKSTAVRALAQLLGRIDVVHGCPFNCPPDRPLGDCPHCADGKLQAEQRPVPLVDLPISATEDRVVGTMDLEHALKEGVRRIEPGILAAAHRGILYVDEVNLLDDHVVDVLLDAAAMGVNTIEREGISFAHPARFTLVGTMNPEEGELRPQLLDRFGLCVHIEGLHDAGERVEVIKRRQAFDDDPSAFIARWQAESDELAAHIAAACQRLPQVSASDDMLLAIAEKSLAVGVDGHRSDIVMLHAAKALAAWKDRTAVSRDDLDEVAELALPHRVRRQAFDEIAGAIS
jgi:magnesium chelatase subunit I